MALLSSPRHRPEDLARWRVLEMTDRLNYGLRKVEAKAEKSLRAVRDFVQAGPCYAGVSWGKDSTVLFDLVVRSGLTVPLIWLRYGRATNSECFPVRDAMLVRHPGADYREIDVGEAEDMRDDFSPAGESAGTHRYFSGVRADESGVRRMSARHLGIATANTCRPLAWWTAADVFAYLAHHDLPVHPNYAMLGGGRWPRDRIRTASIGGERGVNYGRRAWEREYFGDQLRELLHDDIAKRDC